jgi:hypothetical protein
MRWWGGVQVGGAGVDDMKKLDPQVDGDDERGHLVPEVPAWRRQGGGGGVTRGRGRGGRNGGGGSCDKPPKIILYYRLNPFIRPLRNNTELLCRYLPDQAR